MNDISLPYSDKMLLRNIIKKYELANIIINTDTFVTLPIRLPLFSDNIDNSNAMFDRDVLGKIVSDIQTKISSKATCLIKKGNKQDVLEILIIE